MHPNLALAALAVADVNAALDWYERFERPADARPMDGLAEWQFFSGGVIQLVQDADRAGGSLLTLDLGDLKGEIATLRRLMTLHLAGDRETLVHPTPDHTPATYTILNFPVDDIDQAVDELAARGAGFERYDDFGAGREGASSGARGPYIAWFKDRAGNVLSVLQEK